VHKKSRNWPIVFGLALIVRLGMALFINRPGYMDVSYYAAGAIRLARGGGLSEPFLWHYLDDPLRLPRPAFLYWMPLPSFLAAPFSILFPGSFFALQLPFVLISALLPLVAYSVAWTVSGQRRIAWVASLLMLFSGFFFPFWSLPETFASFALFGSLALWLAGGTTTHVNEGKAVWLLVGMLVGLSHLTRADGVLLLPVVLLAPWIGDRMTGEKFTVRVAIQQCLLVVLGYLCIMGPWFVRNMLTIGVPMSSAGAKTMWLRTYDDLYCYGCDLSLDFYLAWGWENILQSKVDALHINFQRFLAENCQVFLFPFMCIGLYRLRQRLLFKLVSIYLLLLYMTHSLIFTLPGWRGGFFHSSGALLPFLYLAGVMGLDASVRWMSRRRRSWRLSQARFVFNSFAVGLAIALSAYAAFQTLPGWLYVDVTYERVGQWLDAHHIPTDVVCMVNNPPGFYYHTGRSSVVVPNGNVDILLTAADYYDVKYLVLDRNHPTDLADLYRGKVHHAQLVPLAAWEGGSGRIILYFVD
jgi:hypothetical protein